MQKRLFKTSDYELFLMKLQQKMWNISDARPVKTREKSIEETSECEILDNGSGHKNYASLVKGKKWEWTDPIWLFIWSTIAKIWNSSKNAHVQAA